MQSSIRSRCLLGDSVLSVAEPPLGSSQLIHLTRAFLIGESANLLIIMSICPESKLVISKEESRFARGEFFFQKPPC